MNGNNGMNNNMNGNNNLGGNPMRIGTSRFRWEVLFN